MAKRKPKNLEDPLEELTALTAKPSLNTPYPTVEYRSLISWKDGIPYLSNTPVRVSQDPREILPTLLKLALDLPYSGLDPNLQGLTNAEAMAITHARKAADGDQFSTEILLDRVVGKPPQTIKSVALTGDINDFLDRVAEQEFRTTIEVPPPPPIEQVEDL